ncbi:MAG: dihydroxy-acid dehydratase [Firmicutes bacterium]|nr:dihydroxy-acid dehydratase [Bacillota bacterium]
MHKEQLQGIEKSAERAKLINLGLNPEDTKKYTIGIVYANSPKSTLNIQDTIHYIQQGILLSGAISLVFPLTCVDDGLSLTENSNYCLPYRELLADSVQSLITLHHLDGVVLVANYDHAIAGLLMGAIRTATPLIVTSFGFSNDLNNSHGLISVLNTIGQVKAGATSLDKLTNLEQQSLNNYGYPHLHSMACICEALGIANFGCGTTPSNTNSHYILCRQSGHDIVKLVQESIQPKMLLTKNAFDNALALSCSISANLDCVLHLIAIAKECQIKLSFENFSNISSKVPTLVAMHHNGQSSLDFYKAGGVAVVLNQLLTEGLIDGNVLGINLKPLSQNITKYFSNDENIIRPNSNPYTNMGSIAVLKGNIAEYGALIRRTPNNSTKPFVGRCRVFDSAKDALLALLVVENIKSGDCIVIKYEGAKGAPGLRDLYALYAILVGYGIQDTVAIVTDGRISFGDGYCVGYITPECYLEGELAIVRDNDKIIIDIQKNKIELDIPSKEFKHRIKRYDYKLNTNIGWLARYTHLVQPNTDGTVLQISQNKK